MAEIQDTIKEIMSKFRLFMNVKKLRQIIRVVMSWHRRYGKKTSANVRLWPDCSSP